MKHALGFAGAVAALALCACEPKASTAANEAPPTDAAAGCAAAAEEEWSAGSESFSVRATGWGPDCKRAVIALAFWSKDGPSPYSFISSMADIEGFDDVQDAAALKAALAQWASGQTRETGGLPEWKESDASPDPSAEFGFYPEEGMDRAAYTAIRAANSPMFCFVQGQESQMCVYLQDGSVSPVGVQTFPG